MPKKAPKNAYFYFMLDFRDEQKNNGVNYANMNEVQQAADPVWRASHPSVRAKYENIAKQEKAKYNIPDQKFTTTGVSFTELENRERLAKEAVERELKDIQNFVRQNTFNKKILDEVIYIIDVNSYCETNVGYVIGEVTVLRFNIRDGIKDHLHEIINPPKIPIGFASDVKRGSRELGLDYPDSDAPKTDFMKLLANIVDYLTHGDTSTKVLPPLYTMPEKEEQILDFTMQLCQRAHEDESMFRVYKLDILFFYLINSLKNHSNEGFPKESLALASLRKDTFKYTPGLACEHHEANERTTECTLARVKRWTYTILDSCCPVAGVEAVPGRHVPHNIDIDAVLTFKEKKKEERFLPASRSPSSCNSRNTSLYDSFESGTASANSVWAKPVRSLEPIRKPKTDTLDFQSRILAPELSESNFPPLNLGTGRGSGRNLASSMKNMDLNK